MKVSVEPISDAEVEETRDASDAGMIPEATADEAKAAFLGAKEVVVSSQAADFAAKELGMTPDEFVAHLLKSFGATQ